ncbi:mannose-1-phosphate guanylyltransferase/mannose-6-phosphate isomerase [Janthinobacterium sp. BJB1]|uniref:mannose-1-phosphate guanylyltransferase/mannose-6-phosphate isomerase n=1 Tax=Janthinobacterium sp. GW458P TaxID=1981504 RepID=UPI000A32A9DD|nr:mannose-1-phosphate guanylyltransferase/mannose-6-phosphate isomerase [Janthinobacterium sp. GW458P]MBE3028124.1 mannose-1-phosphate guanylyltransferase/mannose-6-phosphate isomerase [Janthinobacterium sp. GW458P]PHV17187.1 mannose-1-phosphate guanylyltransferase/mannose-6-phosphate isomerase [Janthinobacterium sp. BJB303]PJC96759.1 mannose-1-phosphate guanylyltransferase/mannose-6-phosphate isomerase [Janthinobacterium sp. BJB1]
MKIYPVILSGGSGTRLWPLSRAVLPKQLLPLVTDKTMLQETALRVHSLPNRRAGDSGLAALEVMPPLVVCGNDHRFMVAEQLREIGLAPLGILLEPVGRNTAPAVAVAAHYLLAIDPQALMLVLPADHVISDVAAFHQAIAEAALLAEDGALATFGIVPTAPETGYGYIRSGAPVAAGAPGCKVERFVEKPDLATAQSFLASGNYFWNSGMFMFRAGRYLSELAAFQPAMLAACEAAVRDGYRDLDFCRLEEKAFAASPSDSIDYAVMEHTAHAVVLPAAIGWSDVGSWAALWEVQPGDASGNVVRGDVYLDGVSNCLVRAESRIVAVLGVQDLVVVETNDAVLVAHKDQVQRVKQVVDHLKQAGRSEHVQHRKVYRPWGAYEGIDVGERFQVKRITVNPGGKLSLQMHHHRAEHWVVVSGTAQVTCGDKVTLLTENESTYIPIGMTHRLENPGKLPLHLIEVQSGSYLGEDDIVRLEDVYRRV